MCRVFHHVGRDAAVDIQREYRIARYKRDRPDIKFDFHDEYRGFADHVCTHAGAPTYRHQTIAEILERAAVMKVQKYRRFLKPDESFVPISTSTYGVFHPQALDFIKRIAEAAANDSMMPFHSMFHSFHYGLIDELLVAIMKGNAHILADAARYCCAL